MLLLFILLLLILTFAGTGLLGSLEVGRNVVAVEKDRWQFLQSQIRVVGCLSSSPQSDVSITSLTAENLEEESETDPDGTKIHQDADTL